MLYFSIFSKPARLYGRFLYRGTSAFNNTIGKHSQTGGTKNDNEQMISVKYPDYKIIYIFPYIKQLGALSAAKRLQTAFGVLSVPVSLGLQQLNLIADGFAYVLIVNCCFFALWFHMATFIFTNTIGCIYFKEDGKKIILSYINYWGRRKDLETTVSNITPLSEVPLNWLCAVYRILYVKSPKQNLKLCTRFGKVVHQKHLEYLIGEIELKQKK